AAHGRDEQAAGTHHRGQARRARGRAARRATRDARVRARDALRVRGTRAWRGVCVKTPSLRRIALTFVPPIVVLVLLVLAAELYIRSANTPNYLVPRPSKVLSTLRAESDYLLAALWTTTKASWIGFALSALLG